MDLCGQLHVPGAVSNKKEAPVHKRISSVWDPELFDTLSDSFSAQPKASHNNDGAIPLQLTTALLTFPRRVITKCTKYFNI
jgi:hypothetical protein